MQLKLYRALIRGTVADTPGKRVTVVAESLTAAMEKLQTQYGVGNVFDLHNEEDAARPR